MLSPLLQVSRDLGCGWRSYREWMSCSSAEWDCGGLEEGDWHQLGHQGEGFGATLTYPFP